MSKPLLEGHQGIAPESFMLSASSKKDSESKPPQFKKDSKMKKLLLKIVGKWVPELKLIAAQQREIDRLENALKAQAVAIGKLRSSKIERWPPPDKALDFVHSKMEEARQLCNDVKAYGDQLTEALAQISRQSITYTDVQRISTDLQKEKVKLYNLTERVGELEFGKRTQK